MPAYSKAVRVSGRAAKPLTLIVDPEKSSFDNRTVIFRHTDDGGYLCLGVGMAAQFLHAIDEDPDLFKAASDRAASNVRDEKEGNDRYLMRLSEAVAFAKDYDPDQPRDEDGRWTSGDSAVSVAAGGTTSATVDAFNLYGNANLAEGLQRLAGRLLGPRMLGPAAAFLGTLFLPANDSLISEGKLPDAPEYSYQFDRGTGVLTVSHQHDDGTSEILFHGRYQTGGVFRDEDGNAIGRTLDGVIALDADAIRGYEARANSRNQSQAGTQTTTVATTRDRPKLCPDPTVDKSGGKSPGALAYQMYVGTVVNGEPLPLGFGIKFTRPNGKPVYLDDCQLTTGMPIEAKGFGYADQLRKGGFIWSMVVGGMLDQAKRQTEATKGRPIQWHFAEKEVADYMRPIFAKRFPNIIVKFTPPPRGLIGRLKKIIEGLMV